MKGVALDYLTPLQVAQLQHTRPDLHLGIPQCKRCLNGQVMSGECLQCGEPHDEDGNLLEHQTAKEIDRIFGNPGQHHHIYR